MTAPLAAICTPVYNGEEYLAETMECVQAQTYPNLVHVVVDNASTDSSPAIIERYRNGRVPLLVTRNPSTLPKPESLNRAFDAMPADAQYFRLLCADDLITPDSTERMVALMEKHPDVGLVAAGETDGKWGGGWPEGEVFDGLAMAAEYFRGRLSTAFAHCVFRKRYYDERASCFLDPNLSSSDVDIALHVMCKAKVGYVHEGLSWTREHEATATTREMSRDKIHYPEWLVLLDRYGAQAMGEEEAERLARRFKRYYFRRMLRWRMTDPDGGRVAAHLARLDLARARPTLLDYCDAVIDWPLKSLGLRPHWNLFPY